MASEMRDSTPFCYARPRRSTPFDYADYLKTEEERQAFLEPDPEDEGIADQIGWRKHLEAIVERSRTLYPPKE